AQRPQRGGALRGAGSDQPEGNVLMDRREARSAAAAASPADERRRQVGLQLVVRILAVLRTGRAYQTGNQVFRRQIDGLYDTISPLLAESGEAVLVALDSDLYLNGVRLPIKAGSFRHFETLMKEFTVRRIAGIRMLNGVQGDEIEKFFGLFLRPHEFTGTPLLEACVAAGLDHILPAVHASTDDSEPGEYVAGADDEVSFEGTAEEGGGWGAPGEGSGDAAVGLRGGARKDHSVALRGARTLLTTTSLHEGVGMRHAKRVVQPLVDGAFNSEPVVVGLSTLGHHDEYTYAHAVNVCMVAVTMGHTLGLDRRALADLGAAALLHDVGKAAVAARITHPLESFTAE